MVVPGYAAAALQGVLVQVAGGLHVAELTQVSSQVVGGAQSVAVIRAARIAVSFAPP